MLDSPWLIICMLLVPLVSDFALTPGKLAMASRRLAPTPTTLVTSGLWPPEEDHQPYDGAVSPSSAYVVDSPSTTQPTPSTTAPPGLRTLSRKPSEDDSFFSDLDQPSTSTARSPKSSSRPDPSQYPDPYPYKPRHWQHGVSTPTLSSAGSSSASTRSSAYTNSARSGDYGHVHVALGGDETNVTMGISTDDVAILLARETGVSPSSSHSQTRVPASDQQRWSYAQSIRSRSSSGGAARMEHTQDIDSPALRGTTSFDQSWEPVEEKDEIGLTSEDETDDDAFLCGDIDEDGEEEITSAMIVAEEGRGVIVRGYNVPIVQLQVHAGASRVSVGSRRQRGDHVFLSYRHNTPFNRFLDHPKRRSRIPYHQPPTYRDDAALS